jgi:hypothetical protein
MKDRLEEFINEHRSEFDNREPSDRVWSKIRRDAESASRDSAGKSFGRGLFTAVSIWRAAAILFFGLSAYLLITNQYTQKREVSKLQLEFRDLESFYGNQIAEKAAFIDKLETAYDDDQFSQDVQKLEAMFEVLKEEMKTSPSEQVKDALILNMLIRIDLLNEQIKKLEDLRKEDNGKVEI